MANIFIPDVDPQIAQKLQQISTAIDTATKKLGTGSTGLDTTKTSVNGAVTSIETQSSGQMVTQLAQYWPNTAKDGTKAHDALTGVVTQLGKLKSAIETNLPAIQTGLSAIQTATADLKKSSKLSATDTQNLTAQINNLLTAMKSISSTASSVGGGIGAITIGGACATGLVAGNVPVVMSTPTGPVPQGTPRGNSGPGAPAGPPAAPAGPPAGPPSGPPAPPAGPPDGPGGPGGSNDPSFLAKLLAKLAGPGMRLLAKAIDGLPEPLQKAIATLVGGAGNSLPSALTSGLLSGPTLSTFLTAALGSLTGSYVVEALALAAGVTSSATTITTLTLAGGVGMGTLTVYVIKPQVLDRIFPPGSPSHPTPQPSVVITSTPHPGEKVTTIVHSDGSKEIIDIKPNGTSTITEEDSKGKVTSTKTVPTK
ncbi:MAG TPA: hypothetical protein VF458_14385 [Ktedonobacteraceae bacterium]